MKQSTLSDIAPPALRILVLLILFLILFPGSAFAAINFRISNFEKVSDYYSVDALITTSATGSSYFVQAMFTPTDSNNYFGYTWSQKGDWFKYISSPDKEFIKSDFPILPGNTTQKILFKPDTESSKYQGPGEYLLKLKRYTGESSSDTISDYRSNCHTDSGGNPNHITDDFGYAHPNFDPNHQKDGHAKPSFSGKPSHPHHGPCRNNRLRLILQRDSGCQHFCVSDRNSSHSRRTTDPRQPT